MLSDLLHLLSAAQRLRAQKVAKQRTRIFFSYFRLVMKRRWSRWTGKTYSTETFLGFRFRFFEYASFVYLIEEIFVNGLYRFDAKTKSPVIFDCGSNIGVSVLYFKWCYPEAQIVAFEPHPGTFELLSWNISHNGLTGVRLHNVALSESNGEVLFHSPTAGALSGSVLHGRDLDSKSGTPVPSQALSGFIDAKIDLMKMDIEGAEVYCIPELAKTGRLSHISQMVIECHHNINSRNDILTTVLATLEQHKFSYQLSSTLRFPADKALSQDVMLYAHQPA